jgi:hypothetical protein
MKSLFALCVVFAVIAAQNPCPICIGIVDACRTQIGSADQFQVSCF